MEISESGSYSELGVKVLEGKTDVTSKASIKTTYTLNGKSVSKVDEPGGKYVVTYNISYKDFSTTLTRDVFVR